MILNTVMTLVHVHLNFVFKVFGDFRPLSFCLYRKVSQVLKTKDVFPNKHLEGIFTTFRK